MNKILAACLTVVLVAATAGPVPSMQANMANVQAAQGLYTACLKGTLQAGNWPRTDKAIVAYVSSLDKYCTDWMNAWFRGLNDGNDLGLAERIHLTGFTATTKTLLISELKEMK